MQSSLNRVRHGAVDFLVFLIDTLTQLTVVVAAERVQHSVVVDGEAVVGAARDALELGVQPRRHGDEHAVNLASAALAIPVVAEGECVDSCSRLGALRQLLEIPRQQTLHLFVHNELLAHFLLYLGHLEVVVEVYVVLSVVFLELVLRVIAIITQLFEVGLGQLKVRVVRPERIIEVLLVFLFLLWRNDGHRLGRFFIWCNFDRRLDLDLKRACHAALFAAD